MSVLLLRQIDEAMQNVGLRELDAIRMPKNQEREEYEEETRQIRWDVLRAMQWLENCRK